MSSSNGKCGFNTELLQAHGHVWNQLFNFINSMSLKCAVQLGAFDTIHNHGNPITLPELVTSLKIHPSKSRCVYRLLHLLVHSGFIAIEKSLVNEREHEQEAYILTTASQLLLKNNPLSVSPLLLAMLDPILIDPWHNLSTWFVDSNDHGRTPFEITHGKMCWEYCAIEPRFNQFFNEGMASDARFVSKVLINEGTDVFEGLESLVDVGGGTGTLAMAIAEAFPELSCTVLDLPHVVAGLPNNGNLKFVGGDMFEAIPTADAVLLKWILHDWNNNECVKILKRCKEAIYGRKGGKVIIIDMVMRNDKECNEDESMETQLFFDMLMMTYVTGQERSEKEWATLFLQAGFINYKITPILGLRSVIEVYP